MSDREYLVVGIVGILNAVVTWTLLANLNSFLLEKGVSGLDVNKPHKPRLPEEGGVAMTFCLILSFSLYAFFLGYRWMFLTKHGSKFLGGTSNGWCFGSHIHED